MWSQYGVNSKQELRSDPLPDVFVVFTGIYGLPIDWPYFSHRPLYPPTSTKPGNITICLAVDFNKLEANTSLFSFFLYFVKFEAIHMWLTYIKVLLLKIASVIAPRIMITHCKTSVKITAVKPPENTIIHKLRWSINCVNPVSTIWLLNKIITTA